MLLLLACTGAPTPADPPADTGDPPDTAHPGCYADLDMDGWGDAASPTPGCGPVAVATPGDCDDTNQWVNPDAPEVCNGEDDDCDGLADDDDESLADGLPWYPDADGDGWGADGATVYACVRGDGTALVTGDCDDADAALHPGAAEICDDIDQDCDGLAGDSVGASAECPAASCLEMYEAGVTEDGPGFIALPSGEVAELWCDMENGGWTLGLLHNAVAIGNMGGFGGSDSSLESLSVSPAEASASGAAYLGWLDLEALDWTELHLSAYASGSASYTSRDIPRADLRIPFGSDGYYLYGEDSYYWCGGNATYTDAGVGATDNPAGAPLDCKGHGSLGSGWDFSESPYANQGLTLCGADGSYFLAGSWGGTWTWYGNAGAAQAIWIR